MSGAEYYTCVHCGEDVHQEDVDDCIADDIGYCILCGLFIGGVEDEE